MITIAVVVAGVEHGLLDRVVPALLRQLLVDLPSSCRLLLRELHLGLARAQAVAVASSRPVSESLQGARATLRRPRPCRRRGPRRARRRSTAEASERAVGTSPPAGGLTAGVGSGVGPVGGPLEVGERQRRQRQHGDRGHRRRQHRTPDATPVPQTSFASLHGFPVINPAARASLARALTRRQASTPVPVASLDAPRHQRWSSSTCWKVGRFVDGNLVVRRPGAKPVVSTGPSQSPGVGAPELGLELVDDVVDGRQRSARHAGSEPAPQ